MIKILREKVSPLTLRNARVSNDDDIKYFIEEAEKLDISLDIKPEYLATLQQATDKGYIDLSEDWLKFPSLYEGRANTEDLMYVIFALGVLNDDNQLNRYYPAPKRGDEDINREVSDIKRDLKLELLPSNNNDLVKSTKSFRQALQLADRQYQRAMNQFKKRSGAASSKTIYKYKDGSYRDERGESVVVKEVNR